jgi:hypothetical protein
MTARAADRPLEREHLAKQLGVYGRRLAVEQLRQRHAALN